MIIWGTKIKNKNSDNIRCIFTSKLETDHSCKLKLWIMNFGTIVFTFISLKRQNKTFFYIYLLSKI